MTNAGKLSAEASDDLSEPLDCLQTERQTDNKPIQQTELQVKTWIILYVLVFEFWKHKNIII